RPHEQLLPRLRGALGQHDGATRARSSLNGPRPGNLRDVIPFMRTRKLRALALIGTAALLVAAGCSKKNNPAPNVTEPTTASPSVQSVGDFQLAGPVEHAFQGIGPPVSVALAGVSL